MRASKGRRTYVIVDDGQDYRKFLIKPDEWWINTIDEFDGARIVNVLTGHFEHRSLVDCLEGHVIREFDNEEEASETLRSLSLVREVMDY
jgi:hypothetical protein